MAGTLSRSKPSPVTGVVATTWNAGIWRAGAGVDGGEGAGAETRGGGGEGAGAGAETGGDGAARAGLAAGVTLRTGGRSRGGETVISGSVTPTWARATLSSVNASGSIKAPSATAPNRRRLLTLSREAARSTSPATHTARPRLAYEPLLWTNPSGLSGYLLPIRIGTFGNVAPRPHVPILDRQPASARKLIGSRQRRASFSSRTFLRARAGLLSLHYPRRTDAASGGDLVLRNPIIGIVCCACGAIGHAAAALPMSVMNSRCFMYSPQAEDNTLLHR